MMMQMLVHRIKFIILLLVICCATIVALRIGKPGCQTDCGGVTIPYPFGIGPNKSCYLDEWFQIDCNISTKSKPFLRRVKLEVLNISISLQTLQVNSPITIFCQGNDSRQVANLRGSPFRYSKNYNIFTAVSCGSFALVSSEESAIVGGCMSICDQNHKYLSCDVGINCCQSSIPPYLTVLNSILFNENTKNCDKFAFLVDKDWFDHKSDALTTFSAIKSMHNVPVTLRWSLMNDTRSISLFQKFMVDINQHDGYADYNLSTLMDPYCYIIDTYTAAKLSELYCFCRRGFEGNPYLGEWYCEDIDECKDANRCIGNSKCVNHPGSYRCEDNRKDETKLILTVGVSSSLGLLLLVVGAWFGYRFLKKRNEIKRKKKFFKRNGGLLLEQQLSSSEVNVEKIKLFKSQELEKATDNFHLDRILGQGGQGTVYKGMLEDGRIVAVKKSKRVDESQLSEFINEVVILSQIIHRNVVQLLGCCLETEVPLLVYEFIPNGTLSKYISREIEEFPFTWKMRLRIATEVAGALSYLHHTASVPIYHRDIKSTNILLDAKFRAKVADFGTSRSIAIDQTHLTTLHISGTFGYLDPEYFRSSQFTEKSDVYSFGVVLVELLTGQKPISDLRSEEDRGLAQFFTSCMGKDRLFEIVDAQVLKEGSKADISAVASLANRCLNLKGRKRPTMREVTTDLEGIQMPKQTSNGEQNYEDVEFDRIESVEPADIASSSRGMGSTLDACRGSSFYENPLFSFKSS